MTAFETKQDSPCSDYERLYGCVARFYRNVKGRREEDEEERGAGEDETACLLRDCFFHL